MRGIQKVFWISVILLLSMPTAFALKPTRVFQIGFSKCATMSLAAFFNDNGIPAVHHDFGNLALSMHENALSNKPLIADEYVKYVVFTDMENMFSDPPLNIALLYFKKLDAQYPGSKFILNTRTKQAWLKSRSLHAVNKNGKTNLLAENAKMLKISKKKVLELWGKEWDDHHAAVLEYFKDRPEDLLVFDIDNDTPQKIVEFFENNFKLDATLYGHKNKTLRHTAADDERVATIGLFSRNYSLGSALQTFNRHAKAPDKLAVIIPELEGLIHHSIKYLKKHGTLPTTGQLDLKGSKQYVYRIKSWASDVYADQEVAQTGYIQGYLHGLNIGLAPGTGGMFTCLLANRKADILAECYYQIKEM